MFRFLFLSHILSITPFFMLWIFGISLSQFPFLSLSCCLFSPYKFLFCNLSLSMISSHALFHSISPSTPISISIKSLFLSPFILIPLFHSPPIPCSLFFVLSLMLSLSLFHFSTLIFSLSFSITLLCSLSHALSLFHFSTLIFSLSSSITIFHFSSNQPLFLAFSILPQFLILSLS